MARRAGQALYNADAVARHPCDSRRWTDPTDPGAPMPSLGLPDLVSGEAEASH